MKKLLAVFICIQISLSVHAQIVADHSIVNEYEKIPQKWIEEVKKMWVSYAGESHSEGIRAGLQILENQNIKYAVSVTEYGTPEPYTESNLRISRATWGDVNNASSWRYGYGEEDWFTSATAINRTKAGLFYVSNNDPKLAALGFGWCWDIGVNFTDYINATNEYVDHCKINNISTNVFFTTGTVDEYDGQNGYNKHLGYEQIRDFVRGDESRILFDYADILCHDDDGNLITTTWNGNAYPFIASSNYIPTVSSYHISEAGALRLGKAMWWMLARMAGWDGKETDVSTLIEENASSSIITVNNNLLKIELDESNQFDMVNIFNLQGKEISRQEMRNNFCVINTDGFESGIHLVILKGSNKTETHKVLIK